MKNKFKIKIIGLCVLAGVLLSSSTVFAATGTITVKNPNGKASNQTRLQEAKLKACQAREDGIKKRSIQLTNSAENMQEKFDATTQRVKDYYINTVIPSGKTVANYDTLLMDIQTKKTAIQTTLTQAQNDINNFVCTSNDPKGAMKQFKNNMQTVKQALKDYRISIKNLIVAIRSVTGEENNENNQ